MKLPRFPYAELPGAGRPRAPIDVGAIQRTIHNALAAARIDTGSGPMKAVAETLRRALGPATGSARNPEVVDVVARVVPSDTPVEGPRAGQVVDGTHIGPAGSRSYRLYVPSRAGSEPLPLVVMLHGCTQSPDDFAAGTRMNEIAEREGFYVAYPAQSPNANGSKCWNWFRSQDQARDGGEPSLIAGIVRDIAGLHAVDRERVFVAGLSAGAAMAVILGNTCPDVFKAVGVHSGLPYAAAHDVASAFAAMGAGGGTSRGPVRGGFVPTIVFHGDRDTTVHAGNGDAVTAQALQRFEATAAGPLDAASTEERTAAGMRATRTVHRDRTGRPQVEQWLLHGAGHAWSGGSGDGSYTAPDGPDASEAMARFFLAQRRVEG